MTRPTFKVAQVPVIAAARALQLAMLVMKLAALLAVCLSAAACSSPSDPANPTIGVWERYDYEGRVIDHLVLDDAGNFESTCTYYWPTGPALLGDYSDAHGTYKLGDDGLLRLEGTTRDDHPFRVTATHAADDDRFALGPYVMDPDSTRHAVYVHELLDYPSLTWDLHSRLWSNEISVIVGFVDPISGRQKTDGGDYTLASNGDWIVDDIVRLAAFDDGATLARDEPWHRCLDYNPLGLETGMVYERADVLR